MKYMTHAIAIRWLLYRTGDLAENTWGWFLQSHWMLMYHMYCANFKIQSIYGSCVMNSITNTANYKPQTFTTDFSTSILFNTTKVKWHNFALDCTFKAKFNHDYKWENVYFNHFDHVHKRVILTAWVTYIHVLYTCVIKMLFNLVCI